MKKWLLKMGNLLASLAIVVAAANINICCSYFAYQPEMPEGAEDLCKF